MAHMPPVPAVVAGSLLVGLLLLVPGAAAFHFHTQCTAAAGDLGAAPTSNGAVVEVGLDFFLDGTTHTPVTSIAAGESVTWVWQASNPYCHSVTGAAFNTPGEPDGRIHPAGAEPGLPLAVVTGPEFWPDPTNPPGAPLSFTFVFEEPGTFSYTCAEHTLIGMHGVVVVTA